MEVSNKLKLMAFDPGDATGVCYFKYGVFKQDTIPKDLMAIGQAIVDFDPDIVVVEEFVLYPSKAKHLSWNDMYASQIIGVIKYICQALNKPVIMQQANVKKFADYKGSNHKNDHEQDAYGHAWFYLKKNRLFDK